MLLVDNWIRYCPGIDIGGGRGNCQISNYPLTNAQSSPDDPTSVAINTEGSEPFRKDLMMTFRSLSVQNM